MTLLQAFVLLTIIILVISLYKEWINPALSFFLVVIIFLLTGIITPTEALKGLANPQIIVIFLLILISAGLRSIFGGDLFSNFFSHTLTPRRFLLRMMMTVSSVSAFVNNTPVVAFMIPYVREWAERTRQPASRFLIPLSYATIAGGMITVIGTSTNLVLAGLLQEFDQPSLDYTDFLFLGVLVTVVTWLYVYFIGFYLLPDNAPGKETIRQNIKEYIVETMIFPGSTLIGKSIKEAGLRNLKDLFLVEIIRGEHVISPVTPEERLEEGDYLFFSGNTQSIYDLIKVENGLKIPKEDRLEKRGQFNFTEAVIPANSDLIGMRIKDSDFRRRYDASIIALHRNGRRVSGKVGEMILAGGDFLLLLTGDDTAIHAGERNLFLLSKPVKILRQKMQTLKLLGLGSFIVLLLGVLGILPLFISCMLVLLGLIASGVLNLPEIRRQLDLNLLLILVSALAIGSALVNSGTADLVATSLVNWFASQGTVAVLVVLFVMTTLLTALITNAAAVAIMFPIAMSLSQITGANPAAFYVAIAFAASGDFMTPIGYQTNLMVLGPGGYTFRDFLKVGTPLTVLYMVICILFIAYYYNLQF